MNLTGRRNLVLKEPGHSETSDEEHTKISDDEWVIAVKFFRELGVWGDNLGPPQGRGLAPSTRRSPMRNGLSPLSSFGNSGSGPTIWGHPQVKVDAAPLWTCWSHTVSTKPVGDRHSDGASSVCRPYPRQPRGTAVQLPAGSACSRGPTPIALLWRPQYPNERPCRSAAVVSAVGHEETHALQQSAGMPLPPAREADVDFT
jgi:hypothetical protein